MGVWMLVFVAACVAHRVPPGTTSAAAAPEPPSSGGEAAVQPIDSAPVETSGGPHRWQLASASLVSDTSGGRHYRDLQLTIWSGEEKIDELALAGTFTPDTHTGTLWTPTLLPLGDRTLVRVTVDEYRGPGVASSHDILYALVDREIREVGQIDGRWEIVAIAGDWRRFSVAKYGKRFWFDGQRYIEVDGLRSDPSTDKQENPEVVFVKGCGEWECCVTGDRLSYDTPLYVALDAETPTFHAPEGARISDVQFFWVFEELVEISVVPDEDCEPYRLEEVEHLDETKAKRAYILDWVEENGASIWLDGVWSQVSAECILSPQQPGPSMTWVRLTLEDGSEGFLPLQDLAVDPARDLAEGEEASCVFGERRPY